MKILILGAGGVGGYIGAKLLAAGADVVFLARGQRLQSLGERGLVVNSPLGNFASPVRAFEAPPTGLTPHVIILACKAPALDGALDAITSTIGSETRILPFLNGVAHIETLQRRLPRVPLLGGIAHGALTLRPNGDIDHLTSFFSAIVGPASDPRDPIAEELAALLCRANVDARLSRAIRQDMWNKFVFLATLAGMTCLMRASIGTIMACDGGPDIILQLLEECRKVASAEGFAPDDASLNAYRNALTERGSSFTSSMLRDMESKRHTEADHILGDMLRRAKRHNIDTPILKIASAHLQCFEASLASA